MNSHINIIEDDSAQPSLIFNGEKWTQPHSTSTGTDSGTQEFTVRWVNQHHITV